MRVLVTGAHGQVGAAVVGSVPSSHWVAGAGRIDLDVSSNDSVRHHIRVVRPDVIVNAAAYTAVDRAETEPEVAEQVNARGPANLAEVADAHGIRLIHLSTDFVFDGRRSTPYPPDAEPRPLSVYGATKHTGETKVIETLGDKALVLRTSWVYAAQGQNFLRTMIRVMREQRAVRVVADQVGTPTAAQSVAQAIWAFVERPGLSGIHHWTDSGVASWYDFAVAIAEEAGKLGLVPEDVAVAPIVTGDYPSPALRPAYSVLDKQPTIAALGVTPVHWRKNLRVVLEEMTRG